MDKIKALQLENILKGKSLDDFKIVKYINNGKSAAVFEAKKDGAKYAVKVFDNELIDRFGHEIQILRIEQEIALNGHGINGLVQIYNGGVTQLDGQDYYYLIMELIDGANLKEYIENNDFGLKFIQKVLKQLIETTEELISKKRIVHRDIKPENIMVNSKGEIVLMDLGVLKFIGRESFSDNHQKEFLGTLRYAPPEFLLREEEDTIDGWRAVNFYQIGAVLHDLIMKRELFNDKSPYSVLVMSIIKENPYLSAEFYPYELIRLTKDMMSKNWKNRISMVNENRIYHVCSLKADGNDEYQKIIERLSKKRAEYESELEYIKGLQDTNDEKARKRSEIIVALKSGVADTVFEMKTDGVIDEVAILESFGFDDDNGDDNKAIINFFVVLKADLSKGFSYPVISLIRIEADENWHAKIETVFVIVNDGRVSLNPFNSKEFFKKAIAKPRSISEIANRMGPLLASNKFNRILIYEGIAQIDESFKQAIKLGLMRPLTKAISYMEPEVEMKIALNKERLTKGKKTLNERVITVPYIVIDNL